MKKMKIRYLFIIEILVAILCVQSQDIKALGEVNESKSSNSISAKISKKLNQADSKIQTGKLIEEPKCSEDIKRICSRKIDKYDNLNILNCIQNQERDDSALLSSECHHVIWSYKYSLTHSAYIEEVLKKMCKGEQEILDICSASAKNYGNLITCIIQSLDSMKKEQCRQVAVRLASIVFSDYQLVEPLMEGCKKDIENFQCGRVQTIGSSEPHSQGLTIECLTGHAVNLMPKCKHEILRLVELQSEDFHLDRALFFACREDREVFCGKVKAGKGKVFQCLRRHQNERTMSLACSQQLVQRERLIAQDYKISRSLVTACRETIKENHCRRGTTNDDSELKLSKILVCLQGALRKGRVHDGACQEEIISHRQMLLNVSPKIAKSCQKELSESCSDFDSDKKLHCLMQLYKLKLNVVSPISIDCQRSLEDVVKEADVGEDWRVDPALYEACLPVVESRCKNFKSGNGRVMQCLMRQISTPFMTDKCKSSVLEIMYFVSRNWALDPQLYYACKNDSVRLCHADNDWTKRNGPNVDGNILVLPCLFRYSYRPPSSSSESKSSALAPNQQLTRLCSSEVRRVMYERSSYVALHPQIEMECIQPLGALCSFKTGPGEELFCLQKNLDKLQGNCREIIANYTAAEAKDVNLNSLVTTHCSGVIEKACNNLHSSEEDDGGVMSCLVDNKNSKWMKENCRAVVENFQIVMMKDVQFSYQFKKMCHPSVMKFCRGEPESRVTMKERLDCLSQVAMNDVLNGNSSMPMGCKKQIRKLLAQRHESINLDPELKGACSYEISQFCQMATGNGKVLECLRANKLGSECKRILFKRKLEESSDPLTDVVLIQRCGAMINNFCKRSQPEEIFKCLKSEKDNPDFDLGCRDVIVRRTLERSKDIKLNPFLVKACKKDIQRLCRNEMDIIVMHERNGKVIDCLKKHLASNELTSRCEIRMIRLSKNSALNYKLDPVLIEKCQNDLKLVCLQQQKNAVEKGEVEECLKQKLEENKLSKDCSIHISEIISEEKVDIHADPLLFKVCSIDDSKFCSDRVRGTHLACLYDIMARHPETLDRDCREKLSIRREMFKSAMKFSNPESLKELVESVRSSPQRNYFVIVLFMIILCIFLFGLTCGRFSRRTRALLKNR